MFFPPAARPQRIKQMWGFTSPVGMSVCLIVLLAVALLLAANQLWATPRLEVDTTSWLLPTELTACRGMGPPIPSEPSLTKARRASR